MQHFRTVTVQMLHSQMNAGMIRFISLKCLLLQMTFGKKKNNLPLDLKLSQVHPAILSWQEVHGIYGHNF